MQIHEGSKPNRQIPDIHLMLGSSSLGFTYIDYYTVKSTQPQQYQSKLAS